ncbi:hypothetical protein DRN58_05800 [Thermococci archaeon]|nr:MAG: hypothetical protein DRN58_05800 [Thermococci archaeon]
MNLENLITSLRDSEVEREFPWSEFEPFVVYKGKEMTIEDFIGTVTEELIKINAVQKVNRNEPVEIILR